MPEGWFSVSPKPPKMEQMPLYLENPSSQYTKRTYELHIL